MFGLFKKKKLISSASSSSDPLIGGIIAMMQIDVVIKSFDDLEPYNKRCCTANLGEEYKAVKLASALLMLHANSYLHPASDPLVVGPKIIEQYEILVAAMIELVQKADAGWTDFRRDLQNALDEVNALMREYGMLR